MGGNVLPENEVRLCHERPEPGEHEEPMDDELRVTVAFLPDIREQIVRESDHGKDEEQGADDGIVIFFQFPYCLIRLMISTLSGTK